MSGNPRDDPDNRVDSYQAVDHGSPATIARVEVLDQWSALTQNHIEHRLLWPPAGAVEVMSDKANWLIPATIGIWIPAGIPYRTRSTYSNGVYVVSFHPARCPIMWQKPTAVVISPLVAEAIVQLDNAQLAEPAREHIAAVVYSLLEPAQPNTLHVPIPRDPRLREITDALLANPSDARTLNDWAHTVAASVRTLTRLFPAETRLTFTQWRIQARIRAATTLLAEGVSVAGAAAQVGFQSPSAFTRTFRRATGLTPTSHLGQLGTHDDEVVS